MPISSSLGQSQQSLFLISTVFEVQVVSHSEAELFDLFVAHDLEFVPAELQDDLGGEDFSVDRFFFHGEEVKGPKPH
jgi:hypothetical protein